MKTITFKDDLGCYSERIDIINIDPSRVEKWGKIEIRIDDNNKIDLKISGFIFDGNLKKN